MNFWKFADENAFLLFILVLAILPGAALWKHDDGCRVRVGCTSVEIGPSDGGVP